jgi:protocatechuate 3,4-dioxygenase alpha subunit
MNADDKPLHESPSQTAGPYVHIGCLPNYCGIEGVYAEDPGHSLIDAQTPGERIQVSGHIFDGEGAPLTDALVEIWQADAAGLYPSPRDTRGPADRGPADRGPADTGFRGWGRRASDPQTGEYRFDTIKPGRVSYPDGRLQAPHISLWIIARGINIGLHTRLYFDDEPDANAADPLLACIEPAARAATLLARSLGAGRYRFDIRLQGADETVFLDM